MLVAEIDLTHPDIALAPTIEANPDAEIRLENQIIAREDTYYLFFEVRCEDFERFDAAVAADETVSDSTVIVDGGAFRVYRMRLLAADYLVLPRAADLGMRVLEAVNSDRGWNATLQVPDRGALREFRSYCAGRGVAFSVDGLYRQEQGDPDDGFGLTGPQREALVTAFDAGYFNEPRDASLDDVAEELGVSSSAASGRLRRAIRALVRETVVTE